MKRVLSLILVVALAVLISACSPSATDASGSGDAANEGTTESGDAGATDDSSESAGSSLFSGTEWVENETTSGVPIPSFSVPAESVDVTDSKLGGTVTGNWEGVPDEEIQAYIQAVKDAGFTNSAYESSTDISYSYSASDQEELIDMDYRTVNINLNATRSTSGDESTPRLMISVHHSNLS